MTAKNDIDEAGNPGPIQPVTWDEFRKTGLTWWINRQLHLFGFVIVFEVDSEGKTTAAYPARTCFRGFDPATEAQGFAQLGKYLDENAAILRKWTDPDDFKSPSWDDLGVSDDDSE